MESTAKKFSREVWTLPYDDVDRLDRAYLSAAYVAKSMKVRLHNGTFATLDTWSDKTILMKCGSRDEASRYLDLVKKYFTNPKKKRTWVFKFMYPGGSIKEQP